MSASALRWLQPGRQYGPVGIELSLHEIHIVQLCRVGESLELTCARSIPHGAEIDTLLDQPEQFSQLIRAGLKEGKVTGRTAVSAMPAAFTQVMPVSYQSAQSAQSADGRADGAAIAKLMQERIGDLSEFVIDYMPVRTLYEGKEKLALVAISREETVIQYLEILRHAGLRVAALEIGPIAIQRFISILQATAQPCNTLVVNCGREKSYLTLMSANRLLADDEVDFGEQSIITSISNALDMSEAMAHALAQEVNLDPDRATLDKDKAQKSALLSEIVKPRFTRLAQEIQRGLMFAQSESRGAHANQVYLLGSIARWPGADALLAALTESPVTTVPGPLEVFAGGQNQHGAAPELAVATGLALREFVGRA